MAAPVWVAEVAVVEGVAAARAGRRHPILRLDHQGAFEVLEGPEVMLVGLS